MKLGTEDKKKVAYLSALLLVLGYFLYSNVFSSSSPSPSASARTGPVAVAPPSITAGDTSQQQAVSRAPSKTRAGDEFIPKLHSKRPEDRIDPNTVDPTLRLDLLAKLQEVPSAGSGRNLFVMGQQPPQPTPVRPTGTETIVKPGHGFIGPTAIYIPPPPGPPPPQPMPPVTFKYYGFSTVRKDGKKAAFFLTGEEICIKAVGEMVDNNYKLLSIGLTSAVVEDEQSKRTQTVPLAEEAQS